VIASLEITEADIAMESKDQVTVGRREFLLAIGVGALGAGKATAAFATPARAETENNGDMKMTAQNQDGRTFAAIRRGKLKPGMAEEFAKRVKAGALPVMKKMDGFKGYYLVISADDTAMAVSLFANRAVAETSTQTLMPWIKENLGPLLASPTEAIDGEVMVSDVAELR
jgi:hypothetical protein